MRSTSHMAPSCGTQITFRSQYVLCSKKLKSTAFCFDLYSVVLLFIHLLRLTFTHWTTPLNLEADYKNDLLLTKLL